MGYRSDVRIIVSKEGYKELSKYVDRYLKDKKFPYMEENIFLHPSVKLLSSDSVYLGWNNLKWYNGYHEIDAVMNGLEHLKQKDLSYRYARIGEDFTDFEEDNHYSVKINDDLVYPATERYFDDCAFDGVEEEPVSIKKKEDMER